MLYCPPAEDGGTRWEHWRDGTFRHVIIKITGSRLTLYNNASGQFLAKSPSPLLSILPPPSSPNSPWNSLEKSSVSFCCVYLMPNPRRTATVRMLGTQAEDIYLSLFNVNGREPPETYDASEQNFGDCHLFTPYILF